MSEEWSDDELEIAVRQYRKAVAQKGPERKLDLSAFIKGALRDGLRSRGEGSVSRRMCNISHVLDQNGKPWVLGWKPLPNVGSGVQPRLEGLLRKYNLL